MMIHISPVLVCEADMIGNDSNLLIVFYVQIVPDDFVMQLHRFGERQGLPSQPCQMLSQIQVMSLNALSVTLADNVQLSLQAGFIQRSAIRHPYHDLKGVSLDIENYCTIRTSPACQSRYLWFLSALQ